MIEKIKPYGVKVKEFFGKVPKKITIIAAIALVLIAAAVTYALNNKPYVVLFTELNAGDAATVVSYLEEQGVTDYRLEKNNTILVPKDKESILRGRLMTEGYPKSGFGYSTYFDNVSALSTESERNRAFLLSVQDSMAAAIQCLDGVKEARVNINPGEDRSYVLDSGNVVKATAGVFVIMQDGQKLTNQQAAAIQNLVAHSVKGLEVSSVSITDSMGNLYSGGEDGSAASSEASQLKLRLEEEYNNKIRTTIMQVLVPIYGEDNVRVGVNCTVDVSRSTENSTDVRLPDWAADGSTNGAGIIGSKVWETEISRGNEAPPGGVVGTPSNSDLPTYIEPGLEVNGNEQNLISNGQIDYDNPRSQTHTERMAGYITDCMVSVSVNSTTAGAVDVEAVRAHVARAAGISNEMAAEKISILSEAFYKDTTSVDMGNGQRIPMWAIYAAAGGLALFLILLILILLIRRRQRRKRGLEQAQSLEELLASAPIPVAAGADIMTVQSEKSMELRKDIRKFAEDNPEIAAQLIKMWLRGGEEDG